MVEATLTINILDFGHGMDLNGRFYLNHVTYIPQLGDILNLTKDQELEVCARIMKSSYLKKVWAKKFVRKHGNIALLDKDIKNLTPKEIREKVGPEWFVHIPDLKVVKRNITMHNGVTKVYIEVEFVDRWLQSEQEMVTVYLFPGLYGNGFTTEKKEAFKIDLPIVPRKGDTIHLTKAQEKAWNKHFKKFNKYGDYKYAGMIQVEMVYYTVFDDSIEQHIQILCEL